MDDDGIYARDAQEPALLPIFSCNFDVLEHIAVFSSHSKVIVFTYIVTIYNMNNKKMSPF